MRALEVHLPTVNKDGRIDVLDDLVYLGHDDGERVIVAYGEFPGYFVFPREVGMREARRRLRKAGYRKFKLKRGWSYRAETKYKHPVRRRRR